MPLTYHPTHCAENQALTRLTQKTIFDALNKTSIFQIATIFGAKIQTTMKPFSTDSLWLLEKKLFRYPEIHISFKESSGLDLDVCTSVINIIWIFVPKLFNFVAAVLSCTFLL